MEPEEIKSLLTQALELNELHVKGENGHFQVVVVAEMFDGMSRVKKQQTVYGPLADVIASGAVHAVSIKAFTPAQWQREQLLNPIG